MYNAVVGEEAIRKEHRRSRSNTKSKTCVRLETPIDRSTCRRDIGSKTDGGKGKDFSGQRGRLHGAPCLRMSLRAVKTGQVSCSVPAASLQNRSFPTLYMSEGPARPFPPCFPLGVLPATSPRRHECQEPSAVRRAASRWAGSGAPGCRHKLTD